MSERVIKRDKETEWNKYRGIESEINIEGERYKEREREIEREWNKYRWIKREREREKERYRMSESVLKRQREIEGEWKKYRLCIVFLMHSLPIDLVYGQKNNKK